MITEVKTHDFSCSISVKAMIEKQTTFLRKPLSPEEKLACTLRFLATGGIILKFGIQISHVKVDKSLFLSLKSVKLYATF